MSHSPERLHSIDALRGADMFWIVGGRSLVGALAAFTGWESLHWIEGQCHHVPWHGFQFYDLIFPLFLFLAGVSMPLSFAARHRRGMGKGELTRGAIWRGVILVLLGGVYNGLLRFDWDNLRYASVLGRIGLAWLGAALLVIHTSPRTQVTWFVGLLVGYAALLTWVPAPGREAVSWEQGETIVGWFDREFLPGRLHLGTSDPEGLLSTLPAISTALAGVFTGRWLTHRGPQPLIRLLVLILVGLAALGLGRWSDAYIPINKNLWTPSFVLWCTGWSLLLVALFHALIDLPRKRGWAQPLIVLGANSILIYLVNRFVDLEAWIDRVLSPLLERPTPQLALALGVLVAEWAFLSFLYQRRVFLRV